jgi:LysR family nitrogen assimilation transcriptional regulator
MDIRQLEYFVQIATLGGFNRASTRLYIAQSALSRQVKLLEEELGVTLFIRKKLGIELTMAGKLLLDRSAVLLQHFKQVRDDVIAESGVLRGDLIIGFPPSLHYKIAVPLLKSMSERYTRVFVKAFVATSAELKDMVLASAIDFAVFGSFEADAALQTEFLFRDDMVLVGPAAAMPKVASISPGELAKYPLIMASGPHGLRMLVDDAVARAGKSLNIKMEVNYLPSLLALVAQGVGYTMVTRSSYSEADERIVAIPIEGLTCDWVTARRKDHPLSTAARAASDLLHELLARELAGHFYRAGHHARRAMLRLKGSTQLQPQHQ